MRADRAPAAAVTRETDNPVCPRFAGCPRLVQWRRDARSLEFEKESEQGLESDDTRGWLHTRAKTAITKSHQNLQCGYILTACIRASKKPYKTTDWWY